MPTTKEISDKFYIVAKNQHDEIYKDAEHPENFSFPTSMEFFQNLKQEISKQYINYPPELHEDIRKSLWRQLSKDSKNISNTNIFSQSGTLNTTYLKNTTQTTINKLKTDFPEKFAKIENNLNEINSQQLSSEQIRQSDKDILSKIFEEYSKFETFEEKRDFFCKNFYDISNKSEVQQKEILQAYNIGSTYNKILDSNIKNGIPSNNAEKEAILETQKKFNISRKEVELSSKFTTLIEKLNVINNSMQSSNLSENELEELKSQASKIKNKISDIEKILGKQEKTQISNDNLKNRENTHIEYNTNDILISDNNKNDLDIDETFGTTDENNYTLDDKNTNIINSYFTNPILTGAEDKDFETNKNSDTLSQKDYVINIEEKETIWTKIKNKFNDIKNVIVKKLNLNSNNKKLVSQKYIDTAENNTHNIEDSVSKFEESIKTFNDSIKVSNEVINNTNRVSREINNPNAKHTSNKIQTSNELNISL